MSARINLEVNVNNSSAGSRLDQIASESFPDFSRSRLQQWIKSGELLVDGRKLKPNAKLSGGEHIVIDAKLEDMGEWQAEDIPLDVIHEDEHIIVVNKPAGLVVHPAAGNWTGTLLNGLLFRYPELIQVPRAGIVHRLDKDTTGLMVVARNLAAQTALVEQLQQRTVSRTYWALVQGLLRDEGSVEQPIGRHPSQRVKMAVVASGKEALTYYKPLKRFSTGQSLVELKLATGRTHQIRVHMSYIDYPLIGDPIYAGKLSTKLPEPLNRFPRQALHAKALGLVHPATGEYVQWQAPLPFDMESLISALTSTDCDGEM